MTSAAAAASTPALTEHPVRAALLLGALGVVFGDIGTSPIYAFRESLRAAGGEPVEPVVLGVLSMVFWAVVLIVALKYVTIVMRADNRGEGGTMALLSLAVPAAGRLRGHCQLGCRSACELRLSQVGERDDDTCLPELRRLPFPG